MNPTVAIVVLNWNNARDSIACFDSLAQLNYPNPWIIAVDNGSSDNSVAEIQAAHPDITLLETGTNLGYAGGNNVGIRHALTSGVEAVCILNNDVAVAPDFLHPLLDALYSQANVGIATPLVAEHATEGELVWALGAKVNWSTAAITRQHAGLSVDLWRRCVPFEVDIASGAAMLVKSDVFKRVGLMDESFFLYFEEVDWSLKVRQLGYRILAVPSSVVWHKVSATLGTSSPIIDYYMLRNHLLLISRHWSGANRCYLCSRVAMRNLITVAAYTVKSQGGRRIPHRNARLLALRDAVLGNWGKAEQPAAR